MSLFEKLARPLFFTMDAETAHGASIKALKAGLVPPCQSQSHDCLRTEIAGLKFENPVGLAAGYDKNAEVPMALLGLGFGFVEVGTLTPRPQTGNPKPRVFRVKEYEGVINRLGFNNEGHHAALTRLQALPKKRKGPVGVNIGANKDSDDFAADYEKGLEAFWHVADYFTANISSPNTPGLRNLQAKDALKTLLDRLSRKREVLTQGSGIRRPLFLKIAPDVTAQEMDDIAAVVSQSDLDALIVSNTTLDRKVIAGATGANEAGGLSGKPLFERATIVLANMRERLGPDFPIIGVGGIHDAASAWQKIEAGANLIQLYSAMVYRGPRLPADIVSGIAERTRQAGYDNISSAVGIRSADWAARPL